MIDQTDNRLREWFESVLGDVPLTFAPPGSTPSGHGVSLYLIAFDAAPPPRTPIRTPLQFTAVYLVTIWGYDNPQEAHRLLGELLFAALDTTEFEIDFKPLPDSAWTAFGVPPQPSFFLRALVRRDRPEPEVKLVRQPLVVHTTPMIGFSGVLLGPGDVPIAGAQIEIPSMDIYTRTNRRGQFHFAGLPAEPRAKQLTIRARRRAMQVTVEPSDDQPVIIRFDILS